MASIIEQGAIAEDNVRHALNNLGRRNNRVFWFKIADTRTLRFSNSQAKQFASKVPADFMVIYQGLPILIEVKSTRLDKFQFKNLKDHQREAARKFIKAGGTYFLVVKHCIKYRPQWYVYSYPQVENMLKKANNIDLKRLSNGRNVKNSLAHLLFTKFRGIGRTRP